MRESQLAARTLPSLGCPTQVQSGSPHQRGLPGEWQQHGLHRHARRGPAPSQHGAGLRLPRGGALPCGLPGAPPALPLQDLRWRHPAALQAALPAGEAWPACSAEPESALLGGGTGKGYGGSGLSRETQEQWRQERRGTNRSVRKDSATVTETSLHTDFREVGVHWVSKRESLAQLRGVSGFRCGLPSLSDSVTRTPFLFPCLISAFRVDFPLDIQGEGWCYSCNPCPSRSTSSGRGSFLPTSQQESPSCITLALGWPDLGPGPIPESVAMAESGVGRTEGLHLDLLFLTRLKPGLCNEALSLVTKISVYHRAQLSLSRKEEETRAEPPQGK